jgi:hypothetical protein
MLASATKHKAFKQKSTVQVKALVLVGFKTETRANAFTNEW